MLVAFVIKDSEIVTFSFDKGDNNISTKQTEHMTQVLDCDPLGKGSTNSTDAAELRHRRASGSVSP